MKFQRALEPEPGAAVEVWQGSDLAGMLGRGQGEPGEAEAALKLDYSIFSDIYRGILFLWPAPGGPRTWSLTREVTWMADGFRTLVERLKAVSHPIRLRVLALLETGELCVCQIAETLQVPQSSISEALRELRRAGFVLERKEGRWVFLSLVPRKQATPLLKGLLAEAGALPEVQQDRERARAVQAMAIPVVCSRVQTGSASGREAARV